MKYEKKLAAYDVQIEKYELRMERWDKSRPTNPPGAWFEREPFPPEPPSDPTPDDPPRERIKDGDIPNFLRLSAALSILLARTITKPQLDVGFDYLQKYLLGFREVSDVRYSLSDL